MLTIFNTIISCLFLIVLIVYILRNYPKWKSGAPKEIHQRLLDNQNILSLELTELKRAMEQQKIFMQREIDSLREEVKTMKSSVKTTSVPKKGKNLFLDNRYSEIFELHEQGLSPEQIAKKLDKGLGEIDFILQLAAQSNYE